MKEKLLAKIHHYYPIGIPQIYRNYPGYIELQEITKKKVEEIINDTKNEHREWAHEIEQLFEDYTFNDLRFWQFPSYCLMVQLEKKQQGGVEITTRIYMIVSLLINYFTIYMEDEHRYLYFHNALIPGAHPQSKVLYFNESYSHEYKLFIVNAVEATKKHFPSYEFISHAVLFNTIISGGAILTNMESFKYPQEFNAYDFLFSIDKGGAKDLIVLE